MNVRRVSKTRENPSTLRKHVAVSRWTRSIISFDMSPKQATMWTRWILKIRSVASGFGRHGMPPTASNHGQLVGAPTRCPYSNIVLRPFDLETSMRVTSKVGNFPSKFGHTRPFAFWNYSLCTRRTDRQTDGQSNAYCPHDGPRASALTAFMVRPDRVNWKCRTGKWRTKLTKLQGYRN